MKVYEKNICYKYYYPEDMETILGYLAKNGTIQVSGKSIESFYHDFSQDEHGTGWIAPTPDILEEFAEWVSGMDI